MSALSFGILICALCAIATVINTYRIHRLTEHVDMPEDLSDDICRAADHLTWWAFLWFMLAVAMTVVKFGPFA